MFSQVLSLNQEFTLMAGEKEVTSQVAHALSLAHLTIVLSSVSQGTCLMDLALLCPEIFPSLTKNVCSGS